MEESIEQQQINHSSSIRIGRISNNRYYPLHGYRPIILGMSKYRSLNPKHLKDELGRTLCNIWNFSGVYPHVIDAHGVIEDYSIKEHVLNDKLTPEYWDWRIRGINSSDAVKHPIGKLSNRIYSIKSNKPRDFIPLSERLNLEEARKQIYLSEYSRLVKKQREFYNLKSLLNKGKKLLLLDINGPHQESLHYYIERYQVKEDFIKLSSIEANKDNLSVMFSDDKHKFGHCYLLACSLLGIDNL